MSITIIVIINKDRVPLPSSTNRWGAVLCSQGSPMVTPDAPPPPKKNDNTTFITWGLQ